MGLIATLSCSPESYCVRMAPESCWEARRPCAQRRGWIHLAISAGAQGVGQS